MSPVDVVVLLGAPGSGKTTLARVLARAHGWRFREWEQELVERWGSREQFLAHKAEALAELHERVRGLIASEGPPVVYETTGISDTAFLDEILRDFRVRMVRLDVSEPEALRRARSRPVGEHLSDADDVLRAIYAAFTNDVLPARHADVVIDTEQLDVGAACEIVIAAVG